MTELTLTHADLELIVRAVIPACATDRLMPVFTHVQITARDGALWAAGTDRYKMCRAKLHDFDGEPYEVLVPAAWFTHVASSLRLRDLRFGEEGDLKVTLTFDDSGALTMKASGYAKGRGIGDQALALELHRTENPGKFPRLDHLFDIPETAGEFGIGRTTLLPASMVRIGKSVLVVPPSDGRKQYAFVAENGEWMWVGQPVRMSHRPVTSAPVAVEQVSA